MYCKVVKVQIQPFLFSLTLQYRFLSYSFFWYTVNTLNKENEPGKNLLCSYIKKYNCQMFWFLRIKNTVSKIVLVCKPLFDFNEIFIPYNEQQFLDWSSIVAHSLSGLMYIVSGLVILVHGKIQITSIMIRYIQLQQGFKEDELTSLHNFNYSLFTGKCRYCD